MPPKALNFRLPLVIIEKDAADRQHPFLHLFTFSQSPGRGVGYCTPSWRPDTPAMAAGRCAYHHPRSSHGAPRPFGIGALLIDGILTCAANFFNHLSHVLHPVRGRLPARSARRRAPDTPGAPAWRHPTAAHTPASPSACRSPRICRCRACIRQKRLHLRPHARAAGIERRVDAARPELPQKLVSVKLPRILSTNRLYEILFQTSNVSVRVQGRHLA